MTFEEIKFSDKDAVALKLGASLLGGTEAMDFSKKIAELCSSQTSNIFIDLGNVEAMNSSGLGMLVSAFTTIKKHNLNMKLVSTPQKVTSLLELTQLDKIFSFENDLNSAISNI